MTSSVIHHEKQRWTQTTRAANARCRLSASIPASRQAFQSGFSRVSGVTFIVPDQLGGAFIRPVLSIPNRLRSTLPRRAARRVFGSPPLNIRPPLPLQRRSSRFRQEPANLSLSCISKSVQDRADALHLTRFLSSVAVPVGHEANRNGFIDGSEGFVGAARKND